MGGADLVVAVGADCQQVTAVGVRDNIHKELQSRRVEPLQVVEEEHQRMLPARKHPKEPATDGEKAVLRLAKGQLGHWRLRANKQFKLGHKIHDEPAVRAQRLENGLAPACQFLVALDQELADQNLECLRQGGVRDISLVLVELAEGEQAAQRHDDLVQFVDHRGLADAGIAGNQDQFGRAARHHPLERGAQRADFRLAPIQFFGNTQHIGSIVGAQWKRLDTAGPFPCTEAVSQVRCHASGGLVTVLCGLGEQFHDDGGDRRRQAGDALGGRHRSARDMAVHQLHQVGGGERQHAGEHLVERDAKRIQIAARVDRAVHAAGLLGCHVGQRAGNHLRRFRGRVLAWQARGDAEAGEPHLSARPIHQDMGRLEVLVDETPLVNLGEGRRDAAGEAQERSHFHGAAEEPVERFATGVLEHQQGALVLAHELQRPRRPRAVQFILQSVFVSKAFQIARRGVLRGGNHGQHGGPVAVTGITPSSTEEDCTVLPQHLQLATPTGS